MDSEIMVEALPLLGMCNLCLNEGAVKSMLLGHKHNGKTEVYAEMLVKCFTIDISLLQLGDTKRLICELCISRLRDCVLFREQVETSFNTLESTYKLQKGEKRDADGIKREITLNVDLGDDYRNDDLDDDDENDDDDDDIDWTTPDVGNDANDKPIPSKSREKYLAAWENFSCWKKNKKDQTLTENLFLEYFNVLANKYKPNTLWSIFSMLKSMVKDKDGTDIKQYSKLLEFLRLRSEGYTTRKCKILSSNDVERFLVEAPDNQYLATKVYRLKYSLSNSQLQMLNSEIGEIKPIIKTEPEECSRKTRSKTVKKLSTNPVKKFHDFSETESMLKTGLFPFKIRKNRTFSCSICPEKSTNLDDIKVHIVDHNKTNLHLAFKKMIFSNSQRFYKSGTKLRCKICTTDVSTYEELRQHVENCTRLKYSNRKWNNLPFKLEKDQLDCPVCKKTFLNYVSLNTHMNVHYPNYICENCGKAFASKARLRGHMRTHEVGNFPCRYCDATFDRVTKRENHVSKEHKSGIRYACKRCNISLTSFYARQKHLAEVHNEELKRYKCKACPQSYITPGHLSSHVRRDHLNERNHKCDKCDLAFYTKNALKMHMIKHDGERIHTCPVCQKSYQRKKTLREHLRIHNNDKRFVCPVCGRAFTQKCTLKGHLKVHERKPDIDDRVVQPLHSI